MGDKCTVTISKILQTYLSYYLPRVRACYIRTSGQRPTTMGVLRRKKKGTRRIIMFSTKSSQSPAPNFQTMNRDRGVDVRLNYMACRTFVLIHVRSPDIVIYVNHHSWSIDIHADWMWIYANAETSPNKRRPGQHHFEQVSKQEERRHSFWEFVVGTSLDSMAFWRWSSYSCAVTGFRLLLSFP